jgi:exosortase/archaeosortase family protein
MWAACHPFVMSMVDDVLSCSSVSTMLHRSASGVPYLPDGAIGEPEPRRRRPLWVVVVMFVALFALMQWGWSSARGTVIERALIDQATVRPAATLVRWVDPSITAVAQGSMIRAPGGGLNVRLGCEGIEIMLMLIAALIAMPLTARWRLIGLGTGLLLVFALNQARIVALFFAWRADRALFDALHTLVLPAALVLVVTAYVFAIVERDRRSALA